MRVSWRVQWSQSQPPSLPTMFLYDETLVGVQMLRRSWNRFWTNLKLLKNRVLHHLVQTKVKIAHIWYKFKYILDPIMKQLIFMDWSLNNILLSCHGKYNNFIAEVKVAISIEKMLSFLWLQTCMYVTFIFVWIYMYMFPWIRQ